MENNIILKPTVGLAQKDVKHIIDVMNEDLKSSFGDMYAGMTTKGGDFRYTGILKFRLDNDIFRLKVSYISKKGRIISEPYLAEEDCFIDSLPDYFEDAGFEIAQYEINDDSQEVIIYVMFNLNSVLLYFLNKNECDDEYNEYVKNKLKYPEVNYRAPELISDKKKMEEVTRLKVNQTNEFTVTDRRNENSGIIKNKNLIENDNNANQGITCDILDGTTETESTNSTEKDIVNRLKSFTIPQLMSIIKTLIEKKIITDDSVDLNKIKRYKKSLIIKFIILNITNKIDVNNNNKETFDIFKLEPSILNDTSNK